MRALLLAMATVLLVPGSPVSAATPSMFLGSLGTSPVHAKQESAAGIKVAMMELSWRKYEPRRGVFDTGYEREMVARLAALRAAGMQVTLGLGLHFAPAWAATMPNSHLVDQTGRASAELDLVFNAHLRAVATAYLARVARALHFSSFWAVRVTSGSRSEVLYPGGGHYWAFGVNAQNGSAMPKTMARNPFPGWKPGRVGLTKNQAAAWATWYVGALADVVRWQISTVRSLGFTGYAQIITPGTGVYARRLPALAAARLPDGTLGTGAAWSILYGKLRGIPNVVAYSSSVGDNSGGKVGCRAGDRAQAIDGPDTVRWSATRWISHIADLDGFRKAGENPGRPAANQLASTTHYRSGARTGLMATAVAMARSCGFQGLYWAHDDTFWNQTVPMSRFATYTTRSARAPARA